MATIGRPKADITLTDDERGTLRAWARRPTTAQRLALRARIVLAAADDKRDNTAIAADLGVTLPTVGKWRRRIVDRRLDGLADEPRPGAPRTVTDQQVEDVVARTLESKPRNATHWSTRGMAESAGLSQTAVSRIWRAFGLKPHLHETTLSGVERASCRPTRCSSTRSGTWSACTSARRSGPSC